MLNAPLVGAAARLSRPVGPRSARTVRLRPSRPVSRCRRRRASPMRSASSAPAERRRGRRFPARSSRSDARHARGRLARARGRLGIGAGRCERLRWTWAPAVAQRLRRPERDERWLFSRLPEWEESGSRPQPRPVRVDEDEAVERLTELVGSERRDTRGPARLCRRLGLRLRAAPGRGPAQHAARRGRHRNRQDTGLSRPRFALGRESRRRGLGLDLHQGASAPARPRGRAAVPGRGGAAPQGGDPQGARELSLPAQPRGCAAGRLRRPRRDPRPARRALGGLYRRTATWSAATCRAGFRACSAAPDRPLSPTGAASASMPAARITANASSSARRGQAPTPTSSSPIMLW